VVELERWMIKSVARPLAACCDSTLGSNLSKIINGRHKRRSGRHTLAAKNINYFLGKLIRNHGLINYKDTDPVVFTGV
jgi:hypothetical protein